MKPEGRTRLVPAVCFVVVLVVALASMFFLPTMPAPPTALPIPPGTVIREAYVMVAFVVEGRPADLVGAWYAPDGGLFWVTQENLSARPLVPRCGGTSPWNGSVDVSLQAGAYLLGFAPNPRGRAITITEAIHLVYPSTSGDKVAGEIMGQGCSPPNRIGVAPQ